MDATERREPDHRLVKIILGFCALGCLMAGFTLYVFAERFGFDRETAELIALAFMGAAGLDYLAMRYWDRIARLSGQLPEPGIPERTTAGFGVLPGATVPATNRGMLAMSAKKNEPAKTTKPEKTGDRRDDKKRLDQELDDALDNTFPASDPVSLTDVSIPRRPKGKRG